MPRTDPKISAQPMKTGAEVHGRAEYLRMVTHKIFCAGFIGNRGTKEETLHSFVASGVLQKAIAFLRVAGMLSDSRRGPVSVKTRHSTLECLHCIMSTNSNVPAILGRGSAIQVHCICPNFSL